MHDDLAVRPRPEGFAVGVAGDLLIRHGVAAWLAGHGGPLSSSSSCHMLLFLFIAQMNQEAHEQCHVANSVRTEARCEPAYGGKR